MKIVGANLGEKEVEYRILSEYPFFNDKRQEVVKKIEQLYLALNEQSKRTEVNSFPQENGKAIIKPGIINHKCSNSLDVLSTIAQYGILASEWFGVIESEREGVFCSFVDRIHDEENGDENRQHRSKVLNLQKLRNLSNYVVLFFDGTNPIMEKLLHLDYFEFERVKQQTPDKLHENYSEEEIELFESIIEPFSPGGKNFHTKNLLPYCDWSAIPGGIPSALVNGICINNKQYDKEYIEEIAKLFPNVTIFNSELEIIYTPKKEKKEFLESLAVKSEERKLNNQQYPDSENIQGDNIDGPNLDD